MKYFKFYEKGDENRVDLMNTHLVQHLVKPFKYLERYHRYEVKGWENMPEEPALLISNHGFIAYDIYMLALTYFLKTGKMWRIVTDHVIFTVPLLREFFLAMGIVDGTRENVDQLFNRGDSVVVLPGGGREAMKSSRERYRLKWQGRYGFIKVALKHNVPIVPIISIGIDDAFDVYVDGYQMGQWFGFKEFPLPIFTGRYGLPFPIPKPVKITHYIGKPIFFTPEDQEALHDKLKLRQIQRRIKRRVEDMIKTGLKEQERWGRSKNIFLFRKSF